jgi:DNA-binding CsgD family transcriptional regulator
VGRSDGVSLLCPELIGRGGEVALLEERVDAMADGRGGVVVLVAEAGAGKTRLAVAAAAAATARGCPVLTGRAVPGAHPVPYRALVEAFLGAFRSAPVPDSPDLAGLGAHLGRLVPAWRREDGAAEDSPLLLAEAVLRLLRTHGGGRGCVLVVEDLHWADPETLAALDYLGDALPTEPVLCVATTRPEGGAAELLERLERRDPAAIVRLTPLAEDDVDRMVAACLATSAPPAGLTGFVRAHGDGTPFLVEELLAGLVAAGTLRHEGGVWAAGDELTPTVPASLRESIRRRVGLLDPTARRIVGAAAMLGRRFDWELLPGIADVDGRAVVDALRAAVDAQIVAVNGDGFIFRHALTREAVLGDLLPPERRRLAQQAWPAVERAHPGLPGAVCELAAELAEAAGAPAAAAERLVESARRALAAGALATAEGTARRARRLASPDDPVARDADETLVRVLVAAGKPVEARELGHALLPLLAPAHRADLLVGLAHAALTAGDGTAAERDVAAARALPGGNGPRVDAVAAAVALDQVRLDEAVRLGRAALEHADEPEVQCEALGVIGRAERGRGGIRAARQWFERAADVAERHGMTAWHLRARHELAILDWADGGEELMRATRDLAARYGALITVAVMDLSLADIALMAYDRDGCLASARACAEASHRFGLATEPVAHLWLAGAHALAGDDAGMSAATAKALAHDPGDPRILGDLHGRVLVTRSIVAGDLEALPGHLETMMDYVRAAPQTTSVFPGRMLWATLHAIDDDDLGVAQRAENAAAVTRMGMAHPRLACDAIEAVVLGRTGDRDGATALLADVRARMRRLKHSFAPMHVQELLIARAALRDGWGDPVTWLREAEAFFAAGGYDRTARRCRAMLGAAGAPVPRRGRGESAVPTALRALGVTSREVDVLKLVAAGLSNRAIGERLYLATKTVERHVGSLLARTGTPDRAALAELARAHGVQSG